MHPLQVVKENLLVKEKLFAKITPRVRQNFSALFWTHITVLNVGSERLDMIDALLSDEDGATCETNFAKCLLMSCFQVTSQRLHIWEALSALTIVHQTLQRAQFHSSCFRTRIFIPNRGVFFILDDIVLLNLVPRKSSIITHDDLFELSLTNWALLVVH